LWPARVVAAAVLAGPLLAGCASVGYYAQAVQGHLTVLKAARPVAEVVADPATPAALKARLELAQRIRTYASDVLGLPRNASYTRFADLGRPSVTWNVVATPAYSLQLKTWCFLVAGCVSYRGYFSEAAARATAQTLKAEGYEVHVYGVPAYSTLGKLDWLGPWWADPLLSTFIGLPEGELARMIFHELAHQVAYAPGDTAFNEAFATAVERLGGQRWLAEQASPAARSQYAAYDARRKAFRDMALQARRDLEAAFQAVPDSLPTDEVLARRRSAQDRVLSQLRARYQAVRSDWVRGLNGLEDPRVAAFYDRWFAEVSTPHLAIMAAYDEGVPAFLSLFERQGGDWPRFYDAVRALATLPPEQRKLQGF
jgi:predicted aminopeptidase